MNEASPKLKVFLCHASNDKPIVRDLYHRLESESWMDVWLDEEKLYPGQDWNFEIEKAVEGSQIVLVFLTNNSVSKEGYIQKELRLVLDVALNMPEDTIFVIPLKLEECNVPRRLQTWQWLNYFPESARDNAYQRLLASLKIRAHKLGLPTERSAGTVKHYEVEEQEKKATEELGEAKRQLKTNAALERTNEETKHGNKDVKTEEKREVAHIRAPVNTKRNTSKKTIDEQLDLLNGAEIDAIKTMLDGMSVGRRARVWLDSLNLRTYAISVGVLLVVVFGIIGFNSLIQNADKKEGPINTYYPLTSTSAIAPTLLVPTKKITQEYPVATPSLDIGSTMISPKDGMVLLYVPTGNFTMGSDNWESDEKPVHTIYLDAFWIDYTEVTNAMYAICVKSGGCVEPLNTLYYENSNFYANHPVVYVSWNNAYAYCSWAGRRLPTEAEWEKAASWDEVNKLKYMYPWGNTIDCSFANFWGKNDGCTSGTTSVASYESGRSPYGLYDMAGNVAEWVIDWYDSNYYKNSPIANPQGPDSGQYRVLRGGTWRDNDLNVRSAGRANSLPTNAGNNSIGFRCAMDATK